MESTCDKRQRRREVRSRGWPSGSGAWAGGGGAASKVKTEDYPVDLVAANHF